MSEGPCTFFKAVGFMDFSIRNAWCRAAALVLAVLLCTGCERFPRDPQSSLEQVKQRGTLRVGVFNHPPWVVGSGPGTPRGVEPALLEAFAEELGVDVDWHWGSAQRHFEALKHYELDIVIGGVTRANPWSKEVGFTLPYFVSRAIVGVPEAGSKLSSIEGRPVALRPGSGLHYLLEKRGARPVRRSNLKGVDIPAAADAWEIEQLGLKDTGITLTRRHHVMAMPSGENALIVELEDFLLHKAKRERVESLLAGGKEE